jgi:phage-related protein
LTGAAKKIASSNARDKTVQFDGLTIITISSRFPTAYFVWHSIDGPVRGQFQLHASQIPIDKIYPIRYIPPCLPTPPPEKALHWVGSAKRDYLAFPVEVQSDMGYALGLAQLGGKHPHAKPCKGEGPRVFEVVEDHRGDTYRAVYTVRFAGVVYVLHAFQKKSTQGIKTSLVDVRLISERLKRARSDYESSQ